MESHITLRFFRLNQQIVVVGCLISLVILNGCTITGSVPSGYYRIQSGDFLEKIAADHKQNVHELADWNDISWPYTPLNPGWQIRTDRPADYMPRIKFYETVPGDTWEKVANKVHQSAEFLKEWNRKLAPECCAIDPGLKLLVSPPVGFMSGQKFPEPLPPSSCSSQQWATVEKGKGWYDVVVRQCGCSQNSITKMQMQNGTNSLRPGQQLCCYCAKP
jgi:LysM repeat protein